VKLPAKQAKNATIGIDVKANIEQTIDNNGWNSVLGPQEESHRGNAKTIAPWEGATGGKVRKSFTKKWKKI